MTWNSLGLCEEKPSSPFSLDDGDHTLSSVTSIYNSTSKYQESAKAHLSSHPENYMWVSHSHLKYNTCQYAIMLSPLILMLPTIYPDVFARVLSLPPFHSYSQSTNYLSSHSNHPHYLWFVTHLPATTNASSLTQSPTYNKPSFDRVTALQKTFNISPIALFKF